MKIDISKKVIACDLDGTLAESKSLLKDDMAEVIAKVLSVRKIAVISGAGIEQFKKQFLSKLKLNSDQAENLHIFPVNGSSYWKFDKRKNDWFMVYRETLSPEEKKEIYLAFGKAIEESGVGVYDYQGKVDILEDRGGQITFSGLGQEVPLEIKEKWDPDESKRKKIVAILKKYIPNFEIRIGGASSIDITKPGINKAYAIRKIENNIGCLKKDILFIGDALFAGGNDETAKETGVDWIQVSGPKESMDILKKFV